MLKRLLRYGATLLLLGCATLAMEALKEPKSLQKLMRTAQKRSKKALRNAAR